MPKHKRLRAADIERQQVQEVFNLGGGELATKPLRYQYAKNFSSPDDVLSDPIEWAETSDRYWYGFAPEWAEDDMKRSDKDFWDSTYLTILTYGGGFLPHANRLIKVKRKLYDLVVVCNNSGEVECPFASDEEYAQEVLRSRMWNKPALVEWDDRGNRLAKPLKVRECKLCENRITYNSETEIWEHDDMKHIYIGEGYEAVYKMRQRRRKEE